MQSFRPTENIVVFSYVVKDDADTDKLKTEYRVRQGKNFFF